MSLRAALLPTLPLLATLLTGCLEHPVKAVSYDKTQVDDQTVNVQINKDVDILFVIDNSGSMADEQALLAKNFGAFIEVLERKDVDANYRIGITTTDSGNPNCKAVDTTPEGGKLVLSSCLDRVDAGEFTNEFLGEDYSYACTDHCALDDATLTAMMKPTETQYSDGEAAPRRWIERIEGNTNLPEGVSTVDAFQCFGPQGVSGCGFESHLDSMYRALAQASSESSTTNYGFLRDQAILSVVIVTDEADCSYNPDIQEIFQTNKTFWSIPERATSAVCWNAGVKCEGDGPSYARCTAANYGADGTVDVPDDEAVLQPLSKYIGFLQALEDAKKVRQADQEVLVSLIAGVPAGYDTNNADIVYQDSDDPSFQEEFGIGAGCTLPNPMDPSKPQTAVPPVRAREFAEAFQTGDERNLFSICQDDYSEALRAIARTLEEQIRPACMPKCVKDLDPSTELLDPSCVLAEIDIDGGRTELPTCDEVNGEWVAPAGATACFAELVDKDGLTPSLIDDLDQSCVAQGFNLEFKLIRSAAAPAGTTIQATCELSPNTTRDCPML